MTLETTERQPPRLTPQELLLSKLPGLLDHWEHDRGSATFERRAALDLVAAWSGLQRLVLPDLPSEQLRQLDQIVREDAARLVEAVLTYAFDSQAWQAKMQALDASWERGDEEAEELEWRTQEAFDSLDRTELLGWYATVRASSDVRVRDWLGPVRARCAEAERFLSERGDLFLCLATDLAATIACSRPDLVGSEPLLWETLGKHRRIEEAREEVELTRSRRAILASVPRARETPRLAAAVSPKTPGTGTIPQLVARHEYTYDDLSEGEVRVRLQRKGPSNSRVVRADGVGESFLVPNSSLKPASGRGVVPSISPPTSQATGKTIPPLIRKRTYVYDDPKEGDVHVVLLNQGPANSRVVRLEGGESFVVPNIRLTLVDE